MKEDKTHPDIAKYAREISSKTKYPIENFGQLLKALGGESGMIEFEGWRAPAGRLREFVPDYYFPVVSEQDLLRKAEDLRARYIATVQPPRPEAAAEARAKFPDFARRDLDVSRIAVPKSEALTGIARLPEK